MENKIYDIIPPQQERKVLKKRKKRKKSYSKEFLIGIILFLVVVSGFFYFQLPEAEIKVYLKTETLSFKEALVAEKDSADFPVKKIETEKEGWLHEVDSTGVITEERKAEGKITVYNNHQPARSLNLVAGTRFLSDQGKYFISPNPIHVPAAGSVEVNVVAQEAGEDNNIGPSEFSIPGLAGTEFYYSLNGKSENPMTGGMIGETKYVTEQDIIKAEDRLKNDLIKRIREDLEEISSDFVLLDQAISKEISNLTALVESGDKVENFTVTGKIRAEALVFNEEDLKNLVKGEIITRTERKIYEESLEINYLRKEVNIAEEKIILEIEVFVETYLGKDKSEIINLIERKTEEGIKSEILGYDDVSLVEVEFSPFWVRRAPRNTEKINFQFIVD